jgi:hypothetical protein
LQAGGRRFDPVILHHSQESGIRNQESGIRNQQGNKSGVVAI